MCSTGEVMEATLSMSRAGAHTGAGAVLRVGQREVEPLLVPGPALGAAGREGAYLLGSSGFWQHADPLVTGRGESLAPGGGRLDVQLWWAIPRPGALWQQGVPAGNRGRPA